MINRIKICLIVENIRMKLTKNVSLQKNIEQACFQSR